jgi:hypothetical protein
MAAALTLQNMRSRMPPVEVQPPASDVQIGGSARVSQEQDQSTESDVGDLVAMPRIA